MSVEFVEALRVKMITPPDEEPFQIDELRKHIEAAAYGDSDLDPADDAMILAMAKAAREYCEQWTGVAFSHRTMEAALDSFPSDAIVLPFPPLIGVTSIVTGTTSDDELDPASYTIDDYSKPARLLPVTTWPSITAATNRIKIRFQCGYGQDSDTEPLPWDLRAAMLLVFAHLYAHREETTEKALASIPLGAEALMRPHRVRLGMA